MSRRPTQAGWRSRSRGALASLALLGVALPVWGCAASSTSRGDAAPFERSGILVMAHGAGPDWNAAVESAVAPLRSLAPLALAFGMADPASMQRALADLEVRSVDRIAVVRLFVSGDSFKHETEYLLGLRGDPPPRTAHHAARGAPDSRRDGQARLVRRARVVLSEGGLADSPLAGAILSERVRALSRRPERESILVLAHGMADDAADAALVSKLEGLAAGLREIGPFRAVSVRTLREDWPEKRMRAEREIRAFVEEGSRLGGDVIVVPFRVFGFGPYGRVLSGLSYRADRRGLLPHPLVTQWLEQQARDCLLGAGSGSARRPVTAVYDGRVGSGQPEASARDSRDW